MKNIYITLCIILINAFILFSETATSSSKRIIDISLAEKLVRKEFKQKNDIEKVILFTKNTINKSDIIMEVVDNKGITYTDNSYIFLTLISIAYRETTFRNIKGKQGEIGYWQIMPSTGKELASKYKIPLNGLNIKNKLWDGNFNSLLASKYMTEHLDSYRYNLVKASSRYNGDKTLKYGKRVNKTFQSILENGSFYGKRTKINKQKKIG